MKNIRHHISIHGARFKWAVVFSLLTACVEPITLDIPKGEKFLVVEGLITDQPGPYSVTVSRSFTTDDPALGIQAERNAKVSLFTDDIFLEDLVETGPGIYQTRSVTGIVGRTYYITIQTSDGKLYLSDPELLRPVGDVTSVRAEFEARTIQTPDGEANGDRFNIYVDGNITAEQESFVRWRFIGTYLLRTNPELAYGFFMGNKIPLPYECSGYVAVDTNLTHVGPCTCCTCWITETDDRWFVAAGTDVSEAGYKDVFVGQANVNPVTFQERYHVQIEQMSLSPRAYEFFRQLAAQADGVESLFQPSTGAIKGNIASMDPNEKVLGLFYASAVKSGSINLKREDVPYIIPPPEINRRPCTGYRGSSNQQPDFW